MNADTLFINGPILAGTREGDFFPNGFLAVRNGTIADIGEFQTEKTPWDSNDVVNLHGKLLMPGLVNAHTHAPMCLFRGIADDLPLMDWLNNYIFPIEQRLNPEWIRWGTRLACAEMIMSGTTSFCDMYLFEQYVAEIVEESGMRAMVGEVLFDFPSPNYGELERGFEYTRWLLDNWRGHDRVRIAVQPHAPYTCGPNLLKKAGKIAEEYDVPLIIHLCETEQETEQVIKQHGKRPVEYLSDCGLVNSRLVAVHAVHVSHTEFQELADAKVKIVHNPESNMKLASGIAPVPNFLKHGNIVAIGTDGAASNNNLDMFGEMDSAAKVEKLVDMDPTALPAAKVLEMATESGAKILGFGNGRLEIGYPADMIVVDFEQPHLTPVYNYISHLVYAARGSDVISTMVAGKWLMKNRQLITMDLPEILKQARSIAEKIKKL